MDYSYAMSSRAGTIYSIPSSQHDAGPLSDRPVGQAMQVAVCSCPFAAVWGKELGAGSKSLGMTL